ncbi:NADPH-dependent F420 reductase [Burkholderia sp. PAMC 28687]|uniref:NADPH-dependent F420 reductase n=1 Tax=Burkholderia sp. PAMC 28687 TaxID=1795874 RepID=UPI0009EC0F49|nr:NAD(P)-binding domain-containing protein [Burkholderia sp. PAMC 28687]
MDIGIIGAGQVACAFARKVIGTGHTVMISNSKGPESLASVVAQLGPNARAVSKEDAAQVPLVLLGVAWQNVASALSGLPAWRQQILIDATNPFDGTPQGGLVDLGGQTSSEIVAQLAPGASVVKAINTSFMSNFSQEPQRNGMRRVLFVSADNAAAKNTVALLFETLGFAPIDLGNLKRGGAIQGMGAPIAGHDFFVPWPAPRSFPFGLPQEYLNEQQS